MNINLSFLQSFLAVATSGSFTTASQELFITQPAVSQHVQALERELGVRLFTRRGRGAVLTEEGKLLREKTEELMRTLEDVRVNIQDRNELRRGRLRLAVTEVMVYLLPEVLLEYKRRYPGIDVSLICDTTPAVVRLVAEGEADCGMARVLNAGSPRMEALLVHVDRLALVAPARHPLAASAFVSPRDIAEETLALRERGAYTRDCALSWFKGHSLPVGMIESNSMSGIKEMVLAGCVGFLPEGVVRQDVAGGMLAQLASGACKIALEYYLYVRKNEKLSRAMLEFLALLAESGQLTHGRAIDGFLRQQRELP